MPAKRKLQNDKELAEFNEESSTSRKRKKTVHPTDVDSHSDVELGGHQVADTPTKPRRGRPRGTGNEQKAEAHSNIALNGATPINPKGMVLFSSPLKIHANGNGLGKASHVTHGDRSARRKSARTLIERTATNGVSEEENLEEEDLLARDIWEAEELDSDEQQDGAEDELAGESTGLNTPSKRKRGHRNKSPTPPQNLPAHEQYFWQNRPGKVKTSNNTLSSLSLLNHEQYHDQTSTYEDPHASSYAFLHSLHSRSFPQWRFELSQSFNICLYGYGSKRKLVSAFASHLHSLSPDPPKILMVNGYNPTLTLRQLLNNLATLIFDCTPNTLPPKFGTQPREVISTLFTQLITNPPSTPHHIFINSLDAPPLRRAPTPALLAQLAGNPHIRLLATCDSPNFPLLWDTNLRDQYNFLFHDTTTFESYAPIEIASVIDDVNELLGRSGRSVKGKEGVGFVLRSLPENARNLYRVLIAELLAAMDEDGGSGEGGVEYKVLYQKVVEEFICSNEMGFRQLLKEFYDHQMVVSRRDGGGAEMLGVPWRREEMEAILEDLVG